MGVASGPSKPQAAAYTAQTLNALESIAATAAELAVLLQDSYGARVDPLPGRRHGKRQAG
ncbi:hypothetical protein GCM10008955_36440 [Deinococcus malanensis]|uniref:Uncharacterized protein n=1 Tax=Deinococcus malanensis TaxID=1706855 RepID=A0ABQ2F4C0_9DEIO|nr:hypothetical protein [Deinococcus malanensis]GGK39360.1 hypothetical protein GCM10008955_36440 [Deinococcus malanensis]